MAAPNPPLPSVLLKFVKEHFLKFQLLPDDYNSIAQDGVSRSVIMKQVKQKQVIAEKMIYAQSSA